jgi:hypothetical protein
MRVSYLGLGRLRNLNNETLYAALAASAAAACWNPDITLQRIWPKSAALYVASGTCR